MLVTSWLYLHLWDCSKILNMYTHLLRDHLSGNVTYTSHSTCLKFPPKSRLWPHLRSKHHPRVAEITNLKVIPETSLSPMFFDKSCGPWSVTKLIICSFTQTSMPPQTSNHCLNPIPMFYMHPNFEIPSVNHSLTGFYSEAHDLSDLDVFPQ